ncbi:MAG: hypothetical protein V1721_00295 [Pseudomonadota bacterium]
MMRYFPIMILCVALTPWFFGTAGAGIEYYPDPVYQKLNADDPPPMEDMIALAKQGDARAQFILGDLYAKGKGGFARDPAKARRWFEESAINGYNHSFIRLAALAKHEDKPLDAWKWYTLAIDGFAQGGEKTFAIAARHSLIADAKLLPEDIWRARKSMNDWVLARGKRLRAASQACSETP